MAPGSCTICSKPSVIDWQSVSSLCRKSDLKSFQRSLSLSEWNQTSKISTISTIVRNCFEANGLSGGEDENLEFSPQDFCTCCHERVGEMCRILADVGNLVERLTELRQLLENSCKLESKQDSNQNTVPGDRIQKIRTAIQPGVSSFNKSPTDDEHSDGLSDTNFEDYFDTEPASVNSQQAAGTVNGSSVEADPDYSAYKEKYKLKDVKIALKKLPIARTSRLGANSKGSGRIRPSTQPTTRRRSKHTNSANSSLEPAEIAVKPSKTKSAIAKTRRRFIKCDIEGCKTRCADKEALEVHKKQVHEGIIAPCVCPICSKAFVTPFKLKRHHQEVHLRVKRFTCEICGSTFYRGAHLAKHMVSHSDARNFPCSDCPKTFKYKEQLQIHVRSAHTGERPYSCDRCGKGFVNSARLFLHIDGVHEGKVERPWYCLLCKKRYPGRQNLYYHIKQVHKLAGTDWRRVAGYGKTETNTSGQTGQADIGEDGGSELTPVIQTKGQSHSFVTA